MAQDIGGGWGAIGEAAGAWGDGSLGSWAGRGRSKGLPVPRGASLYTADCLAGGEAGYCGNAVVASSPGRVAVGSKR